MAADLATRVARHLLERELIPPDAAVLAMVSGGADSTCLLDLLNRVHPGRLGVVTVDHGLRSDAADEAMAVCAAAARRGIESWAVRLDVAPGPGLQARARVGRYAAAEEVATREGFSLIATGHTASDQAETVLFRLARGTGREGATGIAARRGRLVRPLLCVTRAEARDWCRVHGLDVVDDPSNERDEFARTRVRHGLLPALRAIHPGAEAAVARFADVLDDEGQLVAPLVAAGWERCARDDGLDVALLVAEPPALGRLLVRRLLAGVGAATDRSGVVRVLALAREGHGRVELPGTAIAIADGVLAVEAEPVLPPPPTTLAVPGSTAFGACVVRASRGVGDGVALALDGPLVVRAREPGDRLAIGHGRHRAVGRVLAEAGVPERRRHLVPLVCQSGRVVWVGGYRADPDAVAPRGAPAVRLEIE